MFAEKYNSYNPPKRISFVKAWVLELIQRENRPMSVFEIYLSILCSCGVERYVPGDYRKHNSNNGFVSDDERNTPQAFSHFTYESSNHTVLCCDIQGVGDMYTDPQLHSHDGLGFGKGNRGKKGFDAFLRTHQCNAICRFVFCLVFFGVVAQGI
jgi:hypothetical protein